MKLGQWCNQQFIVGEHESSSGSHTYIVVWGQIVTGVAHDENVVYLSAIPIECIYMDELLY